MARIGVLFSGCGVFDGAEIHESVLTMLALDRAGAEIVCMAPNVEQHHVINHLTQEETDEKRNVLVESARIARGEIKDLQDVQVRLRQSSLELTKRFWELSVIKEVAHTLQTTTNLDEMLRIILTGVQRVRPGITVKPEPVESTPVPLEGTMESGTAQALSGTTKDMTSMAETSGPDQATQ